MKAKFNKRKSWEKQSYFKTKDGVEFCVEWSQHYGEYITSIEDKDGRWVACNGAETLPERFKKFLQWEEVVVKSCDSRLIRPKFEKVYESARTTK